MITESDMKALRTSASRLNRVIVMTVFPFAIVVFLAGGVVSFLASARLAEEAGMTVRGVLAACFGGIPATEQYPGSFVMAVHRFDLGMLMMLAAAIETWMMILALVLQRRNGRLLKFIEERQANDSP